MKRKSKRVREVFPGLSLFPVIRNVINLCIKILWVSEDEVHQVDVTGVGCLYLTGYYCELYTRSCFFSSD